MANEMILLTNLRTHPQGVHDSSRVYAPLDLVCSTDGTAAYIAVAEVPVGIALTNTAYWQPHTDISDVGRAARQVASDMQTAAAALSKTAAEGAAVVANYAVELSRRVCGEIGAAGNGESFLPDAGSMLRPITEFTFTQQGSGTPSADNVRPITGLEYLRLEHMGSDYIISFGKPVYGGEYDWLTGKLTTMYKLIVLDGSDDEGWFMGSTGRAYRNIEGFKLPANNDKTVGAFCETLPEVSGNALYNDSSLLGFCIRSGGDMGIRIGTASDTIDTIRAALQANPLRILIPLAEVAQESYSPTLIRAADPEQSNTITGDGTITTQYVKPLHVSIEERVAAAIAAMNN